MMGKLRSPTDDVDSRIVTILLRLREISDRVRAEPIGLDDLDTDVVLDLLDAAQERAVVALLALQPELEHLEGDDLEEAVLKFEVEHHSARVRPKKDLRGDVQFVTMLVALYACGVVQNVHSWRRRAVAREVGDEMGNVIALMSLVGYVVDPEAASEPGEELSPAERIRLASRLEQLELALDEARKRVLLTADADGAAKYGV